MCIVNHLLGQGDVLIVGKRRTVNHYRREAHLDAALAELERVSVVEVQHDGNVLAQLLGVLHGALRHVAEQRLVGILAGARRYLQNHRRRSLDASLDDGLHLLHVVEVECRNRVTAFDCLGKHLTGVYQTQIFVRYHK